MASTDAMVTPAYNSGGQMHWHVVYIYTVEANSVKLLAAFRTGSRLGEGLHRAYIGNGLLIIALNDDRENEGECCATWRKRTEYEWRTGHFALVGDPVLERIPIHERDWSARP